MKKNFWSTVGIVILLAAGGGAWFLMTVGEGGNPSAVADGDTGMIGKQKLLKVTFSDEGQGLRHTEIVITQDNRPRVLSSIDYPEAGVRRKEVSVALDASVLKLNDGPASLTLTAVDYSLWKNRTVITRPVQVDFMPPQISQLNPANYINQGGACIVTYHLSEAVSQTGVQVGDLFYPGHPVTLAGKPGYVTYFAFDAMNRFTSIIDPLGNNTTFGFDLAGNKTSVVDQRGNASYFTYDQVNRQTAAKDALANEPALWETVRPLMAAEDDAPFAMLKRDFLAGIPRRPIAAERADGERIYAALDRLAGAQLLGVGKALPPDLYLDASGNG